MDETQLALMEELCIVVDPSDKIVGFDSKKNCHLMEKIREGLLHRAFSIFLFDEEGRLLMQQRANEKITFPLYWTNTVCSHPLYAMQEGVTAATYGVEYRDELDGEQGVRRAATRKLKHELGIEGVAPQDFTCLTRIHYLAPSDDKWGEHEIDYILFVRKQNIVHAVNPNEVASVKFVSQADLREMFARPDLKFTPWFRLVVENYIYKWWDALLDNTLSKHIDDKIHKP